MIKAVAERTQDIGIGSLQALKVVLPRVIGIIGWGGAIAAGVVVVMWQYYNQVWLRFPGYPWTEWLRDHKFLFWVGVLSVAALVTWWLWCLLEKALDKVISEQKQQPESANPKGIKAKVRDVIESADLLDSKSRERFWTVVVSQVAGTMVKLFFLYGAIGFIAGHVIWGGGETQQGHLAVGPGGELYISDPKGDSLIVSRPDGSQSVIGNGGEGFPRLHTPRGLVSDRAGHQMFLVDTYNQRVVVFDPANPQTSCAILGKKGAAPGELHEPVGIALYEGQEGEPRNLYVFDGTKGKVVHFRLKSQDIEFVREWDWKAPLAAPASSGVKSALEKCDA